MVNKHSHYKSSKIVYKLDVICMYVKICKCYDTCMMLNSTAGILKK